MLRRCLGRCGVVALPAPTCAAQSIAHLDLLTRGINLLSRGTGFVAAFCHNVAMACPSALRAVFVCVLLRVAAAADMLASGQKREPLNVSGKCITLYTCPVQFRF